jgi:hypothetical protein
MSTLPLLKFSSGSVDIDFQYNLISLTLITGSYIQDLAQRISTHIDQEGRAITNRLYDKDQVPSDKFSMPSVYYTLSKYEAEELTERLNHIEKILDIAFDKDNPITLEEVEDLDRILQTRYTGEYGTLSLDTATFLMAFPLTLDLIQKWNFVDLWRQFVTESKDSREILLGELRDKRNAFAAWRAYFLPKISFRNHHLWNELNAMARKHIIKFVKTLLHEEDDQQEVEFDIRSKEDTLFLGRFVSLWRDVLPSADAGILLYEKIVLENLSQYCSRRS